MKRSDIYTLILIAGIGTLASFIVCNTLLGDPNTAKVEFTAMSQVITNDLDEPNEEVFNVTAINPTIEVYVGECEDIDQNGILDQSEIKICHGEEDSETDNEGEEGNESEGE